MLQSKRTENSCNLCPRSLLYFAGRCVQQCSVWGLVVGGAAPSVVTAHKFPTFPTCRQALPCIPTTLSVGRESPLSAPTQGDQQNFSLQVSSLADRKLQQTRAGVAIFFKSSSDMCWTWKWLERGRMCAWVILGHPQVSECRVVLGGPSGPPVHALPSS